MSRSIRSRCMTWKAGLLLLGFLLVSRLAAAATPIESQFAAARWSVNDPHNLAKHPPSKNAIWFFISKLRDPLIDASELTPGNGELCSFHFVNLRHSGKVSL